MTAIVNGRGQNYLLVGESPTPQTEGDPRAWLYPYNSNSAMCLVQYMGISVDQYLDTFARTNILPFVPPIVGGHRSFPLMKARPSAELVLAHADAATMAMLIVGKRAACAFNWAKRRGTILPIARVGYLHWYRVQSAYDRRRMVRAAVLPHPKGVKRWWDLHENRVRAAAFFESILG